MEETKWGILPLLDHLKRLHGGEIAVSVRYPILESGFICNFVRMADAKLYPMPRMCVRPVRTLRSPGMSFPTILTICLYS